MSSPNILLLTIDTLRRDRLGCYGHSGALTPNIDRLARESLRFQTAITAGSWTQAAFPAMLTGTHAATYGGCLGRLSAQRPSPVECLARHGYHTAAFSTNPHLSRATGYDRGFRHFVDLVPSDTDPLLRRLRGGQTLLRKPITHRLARALGRHLPLDSNLRLPPAAVYTPADRLTAAALQWLHARPRPFFLWLHSMDVHWPYHLENRLSEPHELARAWQDLGIMHRKSSFKRDGAITRAQQQRFSHLYEQALQFLDHQIGRLLDHLQNQQQLDNTIIVLASDHGEEFLEHGRWGHWESNLYDEIINVPLIMRLPSVPAVRTVERQVSLLDLMPTLLELCGCPAPDGLAGQSLVPLWTDDGRSYQPTVAISEMHRPPWHRIAIRTATHKLIWDNKHADKPELYDLQNDPAETRNIAAGHPTIVKQFEAHVDAHLQRVQATTSSTPAPALELDEATTRRLRALGYVD